MFEDKMDWKIVLEILVRDLESGDALKKKVNREDELMSHLWNIESIRTLVDVWLKYHYDKRESKSVVKAQTLKASGNKEFQAKNYVKSIELYTKCALHAPANSLELPIAIANRSVSLFYLNRYDDCIKDIELAVTLKYPEHLRYKLYLRAAQCYSKLGKVHLAEETITKILEIVDNADYITSSVKDNIKNKINELTFTKPCVQNDLQNTNNLSKVKSRIVFEENPNFPHASVTIDRKYNKELGRHVIANRFIKKGDILFLEKPVTFVLLNHDTLNDLCQHCNCSTTDIPVPCATCLNTFYCNETCLTEAWSSYHCWECPGNQMELWKEIGIGHLALKVLLTCSTTMDVVKFSEMQNLVTNFDKISVKELAMYGITAIMLTIYLSEYTDYFKTNNLEDCLMNKFSDTSFNSNFNILTDNDKQLYVSSLLLRYILQLICNGSGITKTDALLGKDSPSTFNEYIVATGIYPSASMMNHSCDHNILNIFEDQYLIVRASRDIAEGEEIFNCYGPHYRYTTTEKRQKILKSQYSFTCKCKRCTIPRLQYFVERFNGLKCGKCNGALCDIKNSMRCLDCDDICTAHRSFEILHAKRLFELGSTLFDSNKMEESLENLDKCLYVQKMSLYKHNSDITTTLNFMGEIYKNIGRWRDSIILIETTLPALEERYGPSSVTLLQQLNNLVDVCFTYLENEWNTDSDAYKDILRKTEKYLVRIEEITEFNYGSWSKVYEDVKTKVEKLISTL